MEESIGFTKSVDIVKYLKVLLENSQEYIVSEKKLEFEIQVTSELTACVNTLIKNVQDCSNGKWNKVKKKWHELYMKSETLKKQLKQSEKLKRRNELSNPTTQQEFKATLWWMAEQGEEEDLDLIKKLKRKLPYSSKEIKRLLKIAEQQISARAKRPVDVLSDEELIELTELKLTQEQQVKLSELLEQNREGTLDSEGQRQLDELMNIYERGLLRKSEALREAVKRGIKEPLQQ
ncbi:MAG: hypothetical protein ACE5JB_13200 [bacterium]